MYQLTAATLASAMNIPSARAEKYMNGINAAMLYAAISTRLAAANFLAQIGHESGSLIYPREIWGPTTAQLRYEGRADLGNIVPGDGKKFMGRGFIQVTGRKNYKDCSLALFGDERLLDSPELLEQPEYAAMSAGWFWKKNSLNKLADVDQFTATSKVINGGANGLDDRKERYKLALKFLA
jgi:putative chitinase